MLTIYGYFRINKLGDFQTGLDLFREVVEKFPNEPQHWINLVNLLIVMEHYEEAEQQLDRFRNAGSYGGNEALYKMLKDEIVTARKVNMALTARDEVREEASQ